MNLSKMSRKAFYAIPNRESWGSTTECDSFIMLPPQNTRLHESGYRLMDAVVCIGEKPLCRVSGCSDVFHQVGSSLSSLYIHPITIPSEV